MTTNNTINNNFTATINYPQTDCPYPNDRGIEEFYDEHNPRNIQLRKNIYNK